MGSRISALTVFTAQNSGSGPASVETGMECCDDELDDIFQYLCPIEINNNTVFESPFEFPLLEDELSINLDHEDVEKLDQEEKINSNQKTKIDAKRGRPRVRPVCEK